MGRSSQASHDGASGMGNAAAGGQRRCCCHGDGADASEADAASAFATQRCAVVRLSEGAVVSRVAHHHQLVWLGMPPCRALKKLRQQVTTPIERFFLVLALQVLTQNPRL